MLRAATTTCAIALVAAACSSEPKGLVVGGQEGPAGQVAAEAVAQALEARRVPVVRRFELGGARAVHEALRAGQIDVAVEHSGQALQDVLDEPLERDADAAYARVKGAYRPMGLSWLPRLGWNDPWVVVARGAVCRPRELRSLARLGMFSMELRAAIPTDFARRREGVRGLTSHYGLGFATTVSVAPGTSPDALAADRADIGVTRASDPRIAQHDLVLLEDELGWFPPWQAAPVARTEALTRHREARPALEALAGRISTDAFRRAVAGVATRHRKPADVVRAWIR